MGWLRRKWRERNAATRGSQANADLVRIELARTDAEAVMQVLWRAVNDLRHASGDTYDPDAVEGQRSQAYAAFHLALRSAGYGFSYSGGAKTIQQVETAVHRPRTSRTAADPVA